MLKDLRASLSGLVSDVVSAMHTRVELFGLELAEEKSRLMSLAGMALAAFVFLVLSLLVFSLLIAALFWDTEHRYLALGLLAGGYALVGLGLLLRVRHRVTVEPAPFSHTIGELQRDIATLNAARQPREDDGRDGPSRYAREDGS